MGQTVLTDAQLQAILSAISSLADHAPFWKPGVPVFLAAILGFSFAYLLDRLKTRRENRKITRERGEKELALLSGANTAIAFNVEVLIHTVMQQIMPHYHASRLALQMANDAKANPAILGLFGQSLHTEFAPMMMRCPLPYFNEADFSKDLAFLLSKDPELLKVSGWIITYVHHVTFILSERNKVVDKATIDAKGGKSFNETVFEIETQERISGIEIVNAFQLFKTLLDASSKIEIIIKNHYKSVTGAKIKFKSPPILAPLMAELEVIVRQIVPDYPPPEPQSPEMQGA